MKIPSKSYSIKQAHKEKWNKWFAWFPARIDDYTLYWLVQVDRKLHSNYSGEWYEYREKK